MGRNTIILSELGDPIAQAEHNSALSEGIAAGLRSLAALVHERPELVRHFWDTTRNIRVGMSSYDELGKLAAAFKSAGAHLTSPGHWTFTTIEAWFGPVCIRMYVPQIDDTKTIPGDAILAQLDGSAE